MLGFGIISLALAGPTLAANLLGDPCAAIANQTWVSPADVRACFTSFPVDAELKNNIVEVVNKTLAFHTSVNYQRHAPPPFSDDVHADVLGDLADISSQIPEFPSDFDLHLAISRALKRLNDGHCAYINLCYDALFISYLPTPLVLLTDPSDGLQHVHIAPEAHTVASAEFGEDAMRVWQDALPAGLKGGLESLSGAEVLLINDEDPFVAVDANALVTGKFQGRGTRQNLFFASYMRTEDGWAYQLGDFAQQTLPLIDEVTMALRPSGRQDIVNVTLPYRSRLLDVAEPWNDSTTFRAAHCVANELTNGVDLYADRPPAPASAAQRPLQAPRHPTRKHLINALLEDTMTRQKMQDIELPVALTPKKPLNGSGGVAQFYMLDVNATDDAEEKTGVLMLGSFAASDFDALQKSLLVGLQGLKDAGAKKLVVDVTNNGGGYICIAHWLHRIIAGPKSTTIPQAGLQTEARAGPLARRIVRAIAQGADPDNKLLYNPLNWAFANHTPFPAPYDWLGKVVDRTVNGQGDAFSQELGDECQPFEMDPPVEALFDPRKVAIVSNGRCASSCSLFSITMAKEEGATTVVVGGKSDIQQQYCGVVGGQSTHFTEIDTEIKTAQLKNDSLAPPDFKTNSVVGITWRLGFGIEDPTGPEEWQDHPADINLPLTAELVNNPMAIWERIAKTIL
ncbi:hypothetical protein WOLCODRAFT_139749 [Wolfiporia cocos MD-104 SS10]|uniref:Uncharacterized protein n=1 Tax=Wolfiporia cocos (strain MD-104) TaxID=742152 RepID=A0A2H3IYP5_WOLCO|nr:hypothetical protein WOLCODRAFT_139749 [Wolfiporia cocos MD-104 SS10]